MQGKKENIKKKSVKKFKGVRLEILISITL